ncbi:MAG TPA: SUMF1/EgtB/PvdO family nonheme iron enzyme, partial [Verrucomicrobiota bacterium]|nr:SUMF1/EgtB/PvdO family nonheme iron enzyme [Verrucomicrobiota bacterium]
MLPFPPAVLGLALLLAATQPAAALELDFVRVGQPRNFPDFTGLGRVDETFEIQRHEVTWAEYAAFLNAVAAEADPRGLWNPAMENAPTGGLIREGAPGRWRHRVKPGAERLPAVWVSWHDAARFCNWLHHGARPGGETEHGAYELGGRNPREAVRTEHARCFLPSADEWYKAAYHEPDPARRGASPYWMFPTRADLPPAVEAPPGGTNSARFGGDGTRTAPVGSYPATASAWGARDLAGNV